jgi:chemotaxis methyl-accepting protein methylase
VTPTPLAAARRALEDVYGLALEGLSPEQIEAALAGAGAAAVAEPGWLARVVDRLPIDESWLFRDDGLWEWLRDVAGPELLDRAAAVARPVRLLSVGCSAGQEPFSAALLFVELLERRGIPASAASAFVQIVGIDPSPARVEAARGATVPGWSVQRCRPDWLRGRVRMDDPLTGRHRIDPGVAALCRFEVGNLLDLATAGNAALGGYDVVLCRNVLIYFRAADAERAAAGLARGLDPGARLILSAPEAHLLAAGGLVPEGHLGAGRAAWPRGDAPRVPARRAHRARRAGAAVAARPTPPPRASAAPSAPSLAASEARWADAIAAHVRAALEHAGAGRAADALHAARAALFHDPRHLYARLLLGQALLRVDGGRARAVLHELVDSVSRLPGDEPVPCADGLSVAQLASAARLLLDAPEGA